MEKRRITIIIPAYNEKKGIEAVWLSVSDAIAPLEQRYAFEILFVDDGSTDGTAQELESLTARDGRVDFLSFSRNFGKEIATTAGLHAATGDAAIMLDADLQHPPALIPEFIRKWEEGAEIVIGLRTNDASQSVVRKLGARFFYAAMDRISETRLDRGGTDFRLLSRPVIDAFNSFTERSRITRGLVDWLGFKRAYVPFAAPDRAGEKGRYGFLRLTHLALSSFVSHSLFPLKFTGYLGVFISVASGLLGVFILVEKYILGDPLGLDFSGPAMLAVVIIFLVGIILSCLGLIALYIANIHAEVMNRPLYVVRKRSHPVRTPENTPYENPLVHMER